MSKLDELREFIRAESEGQPLDQPVYLLASEEGWNEVLEAIDPRVDPVARRAGPMWFDGLAVVIDLDLPAGSFKLQFGMKKTAT